MNSSDEAGFGHPENEALVFERLESGEQSPGTYLHGAFDARSR